VKDVKQEWLERPEAGTAFGYKLMSGFARLCGRSAARLVLYPLALYFLIRRGPERRASRAYLERVCGRPPSLWQVARHIHTFAAVVLDRAFLLAERYKRFDIRVHGLDDLRAAWGRQQGVLVFGSHLGSFEALRVLAQVRPDVKVRVVIDVEQNPALSRVLNALNPELARSIINARREGMTTALAIKEALDEKALVTLLVDRARPGNEVALCDFLGHPAPFPVGPWQLAAALKVPVVLCFGLYRGGNRYDLYFEPFADTLALERTRREEHLREVTARFAGRLEHYTRDAPYNWFNFYDFWQTETAHVARADDAAGAVRDGGGT
jgi:predicted LPLAT superfamily acyltransferase